MMKYAKLKIRPIDDENSRVVAHFQFNVPLDNDVVLSCLNGSIVCGKDDPSRLYVLYPRIQSQNGRDVATWLLAGKSQQIFDNFVLEQYRRSKIEMWNDGNNNRRTNQ